MLTGDRILFERFLWIKLVFVGKKVCAITTLLFVALFPFRGVEMNFLLLALIIVDELIGGWIEVWVSRVSYIVSEPVVSHRYFSGVGF